jgi:hypothetical protein
MSASSEETAYTPESTPKTKDWLAMNQNDSGKYGSGPGLQDPNGSIQSSNAAYANHLNKAADKVGAGQEFEDLRILLIWAF